jgi:DNA-binding IclR family transcriptional regulator
VVEIVELLTKRHGEAVRLSDIVKTLGLNQATAHTIMKELVDTGWVTRNAVTKTFSIGGRFVSLATMIDQAPSVANAAKAAAEVLAGETGYAASVSERAQNDLVITAFIAGSAGHDDRWHPAVGDQLPFAAPFGPAYAAWEPDAERQAWIRRSGVSSHTFQASLERFLEDTLSRGFTVERMSPEMVSAVPVMTKLQSATLSESMREHLDQILLEMTGFPDDLAESSLQRAYVGAISTPIFDKLGRVINSISLHPFIDLSPRKIEQIGRRMRKACEAIQAELR